MNKTNGIGVIKNLKAIVILLFVVANAVFAQQEKKQSSLAMIQSLPVFFPLSTEDFVRVSSNYGYRKHPILNTIRKHTGIDLVAPKGKPVIAVADGYIEQADFDSSYGNRIVIRHKEKIKTLYAHLSSKSVKEGQKVKSGDVIGYVGDTGRATGPHLHYEILINDIKINPMIFWKLIFRKTNKKNG